MFNVRLINKRLAHGGLGSIMGLKVTNIVTADTFEVFPPWCREDQSGIKVTVAGLDIPHWRERSAMTRPRTNSNHSY
jgi:hypothetical protein